jgi:hypothetical protein
MRLVGRRGGGHGRRGLIAELQERKIRELPVYLPHKFEAGLLETKEELDELRESLKLGVPLATHR